MFEYIFKRCFKYKNIEVICGGHMNVYIFFQFNNIKIILFIIRLSTNIYASNKILLFSNFEVGTPNSIYKSLCLIPDNINKKYWCIHIRLLNRIIYSIKLFIQNFAFFYTRILKVWSSNVISGSIFPVSYQ